MRASGEPSWRYKNLGVGSGFRRRRRGGLELDGWDPLSGPPARIIGLKNYKT